MPADDGQAGPAGPGRGGAEDGWGGRVGARLHELDPSARAALERAGRALEGRSDPADLLRVRPLLTLAVAFVAGFLLARMGRR